MRIPHGYEIQPVCKSVLTSTIFCLLRRFLLAFTLFLALKESLAQSVIRESLFKHVYVFSVRAASVVRGQRKKNVFLYSNVKNFYTLVDGQNLGK